MTTQMTMELTGSALRDIGMTRALDHTERDSPRWMEETIQALRIFCQERKAQGKPEFTMEEFREGHQARRKIQGA